MRRLAPFVFVVLTACGRGEPPSTGGLVVIASVDTLVTAQSAALAYVSDLDVAPSGLLYAADVQANQLFVLDPGTGDTTRLGGLGKGPGEFDDPQSIRALDDGVLVVDRGNGRVQRVTSTGRFVNSMPISPMVMTALPFVRSDGSIVVGSDGRDSCLAVVFDSAGSELRRVGTPVVTPPAVLHFGAIKATIAKGEVPAFLRNDALVAEDDEGGVWVALQTEAEVRRYNPEGELAWVTKIQAPELSAARAEFFRNNAAEKNPARFFNLTSFPDLAVVGQNLWILLATQPGASAVVIALGPDGTAIHRIEVRGAGGASSFAVDQARKRLFLFTPEDAQLLEATVPFRAFQGVQPKSRSDTGT